MKELKGVFPKALASFLAFTVICGILYTAVVTGVAQLLFHEQADGSIIEVDGKRYGCELLGQQYTDDAHLWGRIMNLDVSTFEDGTAIPVDLVTCSGSGLDPHISPAAAEYQVPRIAAARGMTEAQVREAIASCTRGRFLGVFGEETVNVLKVNLTLDGILK